MGPSKSKSEICEILVNPQNKGKISLHQKNIKLIFESWRAYQTLDEMATRASKEGVKLPDLLAVVKTYAVAEDETPTHFITYTSLNKVGINPQSEHNTPNGIYVYPLIESIIKQIETGTLPFAQEQKYVSIVKQKDGVNILSHRTKLGYKASEYIEKIFSTEAINTGLIKDPEMVATIVHLDTLEEEDPESKRISPFGKWPHWISVTPRFYVLQKQVPYFRRIMSEASQLSKSDFALLWNTTRRAAYGNPNTWSAILRWLGFDGAYDSGSGIIHNAEPVQGVFFSKAAVDVIETLPNKFTPQRIEIRKKNWLIASVGKLAHTAVREENLFGLFFDHEVFKIIRSSLAKELILLFYRDVGHITPESLGYITSTDFDWGLSAEYDKNRKDQDVKDLLYTLAAAPESDQYKKFWYSDKTLSEIFSSFTTIVKTWMSRNKPKPDADWYWKNADMEVREINIDLQARFIDLKDFQESVRSVLGIAQQYKEKLNIPTKSLSLYYDKPGGPLGPPLG